MLDSKVLRQFSLSSVTTNVCFYSDFMISSLFAYGMYCAGGDHNRPCKGDSGEAEKCIFRSKLDF